VKGLSLRVFVDGLTYASVIESRKPNELLTKSCRDHRKIVEAAALVKAKAYN
jgi:hypothetical protein